MIRLNWRLAHLGTHLTDYVVAHERFWSLVEKLYPDWRHARAQLERAGGGAAETGIGQPPYLPKSAARLPKGHLKLGGESACSQFAT